MAKHGFQPNFKQRTFNHNRVPGQTRGPGQNRGAPVVKSRLSNALTKISQDVDLDLMESAFGIGQDNLREIISGRNPGIEPGFTAHIGHRIAHTPPLARWFETPDAAFTKDLVKELKFLASTSQRRQGLRRENFKQLAKSFENNISVLADALQLAEHAVLRILSGELEFDDQRFGHINPLLVAAGFEDGWLELPDPSVSDSMIERLQQLANDEFEDTTVVPQPTESHVIAAQSPEIEETSGSDVYGVLGADSKIDGNTVESAPLDLPQVKETEMAKSVKPTATAPQAGTQSVASRTALLSRGALSSGRSVLSGTAGTAKPIPTAPGLLVAPQGTSAGPTVVHRTPKLKANPIQSAVSAAMSTAAPAAPAEPTAPVVHQVPPSSPAIAAQQAANAVAEGRTLAKAPRIKKVDAKKTAGKLLTKGAAKTGRAIQPATAPVASPDVNTNGRVNLAKPDDSQAKQISLARAAALETLLATSRRGAKVTLWRELLKSSLPVWGNIRRGQVLLRDNQADQITKFMGLPQGWLDNPVFPPQSLSAWVTDPLVPLPTAQSIMQQGLDLAPATPAAATAVATPVADTPSKAPKAAAPVTAAPAAHAAAKIQTPSAQDAVTWTPATNPVAAETTGPIGNALLSVMDGLMKSGKFTEGDALTMLNYMVAKQM